MSPQDINRIKLIETFNGFPIEEQYSVIVYIGKSMYANDDKTIVIDIPDAEIDKFFEYQGYIDGYTRIPGKGRYGETLESSEMVLMFDKTLRNVLNFCYEYNRRFSQEAVYIDINPPTQLLIKERQTI
ncbi:MAG: hypothetical protein HC932_01050 [Thermales bacterium]|nr:hypothetical protein [Thermales bacterium]